MTTWYTEMSTTRVAAGLQPNTLPSWEPNIMPPTVHRPRGAIVGREGVKPFSMAIVGGTGLGKTQWLRAFWSKYLAGKFDIIVLVCSTANRSNDYRFLEHGAGGGARLKTHTEWNPNIVTWINSIQDKRTASGKEMLSVALVADDMKGSSFKNCQVANDLWRLGRHSGITPICITHRLNRLSTECRSGVMILVAFRCVGPNWDTYQKEVLKGTGPDEYPNWSRPDGVTGPRHHTKDSLQFALTRSVWNTAYNCLVRDDTVVNGKCTMHRFTKSTASDFGA